MSKCLVILSGGQDSTTCAAIACKEFSEVHAVTFNYGQKHLTEIESAIAVGRSLNLTSHEIIDLGHGILKGTSPLVSDLPLETYNPDSPLPQGVEPTFVPARNILFLTIAANRAAVLGIEDIFIGVCEADFAGYWDCRSEFIKLMSDAISYGIYGSVDKFTIHTPLMNLTKAQSVLLAKEVLGDRFEKVLELTHTCYAGVKGGCGQCHACILRDRGFKEAGIGDPIWKYRR